MNILHINSYYSSSEFYKNLYELQNRELSNKISVYLPVTTSYILKFNHGSYTIISKNHNKIDRLFFHIKHNKILKDIKNVYDIKNFDLIHAHSLFSNGYLAYKLKEEYGLPYIVAVRNTDVNLFFEKIFYLRKLGVKILENAEKIIFLSNSYKEYTINKFIPKDIKVNIEKKSVVIPNGVDDFWIKNKFNSKIKPLDNSIKLIYAGRIDKNKNIETTIKACKLLINDGYDVNYHIIGNIENKKYYKIINDNSFVKYTEHSNKEELIRYYREADIFVMPSHKETFGLVYLEAMSQGLPVIYSSGQGFDGQFEEGEVGFSVDSNSPNKILEAIYKILDSYNNISRKCLKKVVKFTWENISNQYAMIYEEVVRKNEDKN